MYWSPGMGLKCIFFVNVRDVGGVVGANWGAGLHMATKLLGCGYSYLGYSFDYLNCLDWEGRERDRLIEGYTQLNLSERVFCP